MGFRNPFRVDVDSDGVIYTSDYSPDSNTPSRGRGPRASAATRSSASRPTTAGRRCYSSKLGYWEWEFSEFGTAVNAQGVPTAGIIR